MTISQCKIAVNTYTFFISIVINDIGTELTTIIHGRLSFDRNVSGNRHCVIPPLEIVRIFAAAIITHFLFTF